MKQVINFTLNGVHVQAQKGDTILQAARKAGIFIPTMCYLSKTNPIASCRLCVVEAVGTDGFVLSCQTPVVEGAVINTSSPTLDAQRQNIMKLYAVNHPLECGVCDKSGACDLQNGMLDAKVTTQNFAAKEQKRAIENWGLIQYDPSLCILCEKCVHVCNEVIGDDAIEIRYGGYNSSIIPKKSDKLDCTFCGECIAVCPVGALISTDFKYTANAWELDKVPSSCAHCSSTCSLTYEVKNTPTATGKSGSIYRVTNDFEFSTLCGAGRFGFDYHNDNATKETTQFNKAIAALKNAKGISFSGLITNEEASMLQYLKDKLSLKLINPEVKAYQSFLRAMSLTSGQSLYNGTLKDISMSDFTIIMGSAISTDNPAVRYEVTKAVKQHNGEVIYMHPIEDHLLASVVTHHVKYEVGSEEGIIALLVSNYLSHVDSLSSMIDEWDIGYLSAESNFDESEQALLQKRFDRKKSPVLILGADLYTHPQAENIAKLAGLFQRHSNFKVVVIPPSTNALGVSLICDLDDHCDGMVVGYNAPGDFVLTALGASGENELDMPALNQQEGTFVSIDKRVVPLNAAVDYQGFELLDLVNEFGLDKKYAIDLTSSLPTQKGFEPKTFDSLPNYFDNAGVEQRGYILSSFGVEPSGKVEELSDIGEFNGTVVYRCNPVLQFSPFTAKCGTIKTQNNLIGSAQFAVAGKCTDNENIVLANQHETTQARFALSPDLKGTIALRGDYERDFSNPMISSLYRYTKTKITKNGTAQ